MAGHHHGIVGDAIMRVISGAMMAFLTSPIFRIGFIIALSVAALVAFPVNRWLIARGMGHAVVHEHHRHH